MLSEERFIVMVHPYRYVGDFDNETQEHCEHDEADGFNVWIRHNYQDPDPDDDPFGAVEGFDRDFDIDWERHDDPNECRGWTRIDCLLHAEFFQDIVREFTDIKPELDEY